MNEDIEQKIKLTYETNANEASKEVNDLSGSIEKAETSQVRATKTTKKSGEAHKAAAKSAKGQGEALGSLGGPMGQAVSGMKAMLKQMWLMVANPIVLTIVAIVGGLALLFKAFTSTNAGADKFKQIMSGVSATIDILRDRFLKIAGAIAKFMTGDFKGAMADGKAAVAGFGAEVEKEFKIAANATKELQEVEDAMRSLGETRAMLNRDLSAAKEIIADENATYAEKKKAIDAVRIAEGQQTEQELANAKRKLKAIQDLNALSDTGDEDLKKESAAKIAVYNLEQESANNRRAINKADERADNDERIRLKTLASERAAVAKENEERLKAIAKLKQDLLDEEYSEEQKASRKIEDLKDKTEEEKLARQKERDLADIELLKKKGVDTRDLLILNDELYKILEEELRVKKAEEKAIKDKEIADAEKAANEKKAAEEKDAADKAAADAKIVAEAKETQYKSNLSNLQTILALGGKKLAAISKGLAIMDIVRSARKSITETISNTGIANAKAVAASPLTGGMPFVGINTAQGALSIGATIASSSMSIKSILGDSKSMSSGSGVSNSGGSGGGASATPQVNFQGSKENQIGNTLAGKLNEQAPIRVTVLENDITKVQAGVQAKVVSNSF